MAKPRIEIYQHEYPEYGWKIRVGDRYEEHLSYGEMLEYLIAITKSGRVDLSAPCLLTEQQQIEKLMAAGVQVEGEPLEVEFPETMEATNGDS